jgi:hypothetical protein
MSPPKSMRALIVKGLSYTEPYVVFPDALTITYHMGGDLLAGYETSLFQLQTPRAPTVFDPSLYLELASHNYAEVNLFDFVKFRFRLDLEAIRYDFLNFELVWSAYNDLA